MEVTEEGTSAPLPPPVDTSLRLKIREYARQQRKELRMDSTDALRFGLGQIKDKIRELESLGAKDVHGLASRIKRRKHATSEDMYRLGHAFLQCSDNIASFAGVQGATQVIVKELTGNQLQRQIEAAECLCNLSLGEPYVCEKITTLAGSYLVTFLDSPEPRLKRTCLWTLANILATCQKSANMLLQMQLVAKLWKLYTSPASGTCSTHEDAATCLYLIASQVASSVGAEDRRYIAENLHRKQPGEPASCYYMYIIFQLEILTKERDLCSAHFQHIWDFFEAEPACDLSKPLEKLHMVYGVQLLSVLFALRPTLALLHLQEDKVVNTLNRLFALQDSQLTADLLQLVKNLMETQLLDNEQLLDQLRVYAQ